MKIPLQALIVRKVIDGVAHEPLCGWHALYRQELGPGQYADMILFSVPQLTREEALAAGEAARSAWGRYADQFFHVGYVQARVVIENEEGINRKPDTSADGCDRSA